MEGLGASGLLSVVGFRAGSRRSEFLAMQMDGLNESLFAALSPRTLILKP